MKVYVLFLDFRIQTYCGVFLSMETLKMHIEKTFGDGSLTKTGDYNFKIEETIAK